MKIFVVGLGHLGTVTAACAARHFDVMAYEPRFDKALHPYSYDSALLGAWAETDPQLVHGCHHAAACDVVWIAIDTPIVGEDAVPGAVFEDAAGALNHARAGTIAIISSQLPAGSMRLFAERWPSLRFVCQPENLRVGKGLGDFRQPDRIVVGINDTTLREPMQALFGKWSDNIIWTSIETAEVVKHAINSYLSMTIAFANEFGGWAKSQGANLKDLERCMKTDSRIGPRAYLAYGDGPGSHLSRDVKLLSDKIGGLFSDIRAAHERFKVTI